MISVCMPTYNGARFVRCQLESILKQLSSDDEIIISDDSSSDETVGIIKSFNDRRITLLENNCFHSPIYNLEHALENARGDYIFLSDQDDEWKENKVACCMEYLQRNSLVIHDAEVVDENKNLLHASFYKLNHTKKSAIYNLVKNGYVGCCMAFRREILERSLPFPKKLPMHDLWIGNVAAFKCGKISFIPDKLIYYRRHGNNASITGEKSSRKLLERLKDRCIIVKNLITNF